MKKSKAQQEKFDDLPSSEYHADPRISAGSLETVHTHGVPALIHQSGNPKKATPDMQLGTLTHTLVLEPHNFGKQYIMIPKLNYQFKKNKELKAELEKRAFDEDLIVIDQKQYDHALAMSKSVLAHPHVQKIMEKGRPEVSYFWEKDGSKLKARPDWVNGKYWMDLKTAKDATRQGFVRACGQGGYHRRASFYIDCAKYHGQDVDYIYVLVHKTPPYQVGIYTIINDDLDVGRTQYTSALTDLQEYKPEDAKFGFSRLIQSVSMPDWALN